MDNKNLIKYGLLALSPIGAVIPLGLTGNIFCEINDVYGFVSASNCVIPGFDFYYNFVMGIFMVSLFVGLPLIWVPVAIYIWYKLLRGLYAENPLEVSKTPPAKQSWGEKN